MLCWSKVSRVTSRKYPTFLSKLLILCVCNVRKTISNSFIILFAVWKIRVDDLNSSSGPAMGLWGLEDRDEDSVTLLNIVEQIKENLSISLPLSIHICVQKQINEINISTNFNNVALIAAAPCSKKLEDMCFVFQLTLLETLLQSDASSVSRQRACIRTTLIQTKL